LEGNVYGFCVVYKHSCVVREYSVLKKGLAQQSRIDKVLQLGKAQIVLQDVSACFREVEFSSHGVTL